MSLASIGISLKIWSNKQNKTEWTSLMGPDKKRMLKNFPELFTNFLVTDEVEQTQQLWQVINYNSNIGYTQVM